VGLYADLIFALENCIVVMMAKIAGKHVCKESLVVLLCLFLIGNVAHGTVLCFGADGHIEFESAFHIHGDDHAHDQPLGHRSQSFEIAHEASESPAWPCVDVPLTIDLFKISHTIPHFGPAFAVVAAEAIATGENFNLCLLSSNPYTLFSTSYFAPLRTVILLA